MDNENVSTQPLVANQEVQNTSSTPSPKVSLSEKFTKLSVVKKILIIVGLILLVVVLVATPTIYFGNNNTNNGSNLSQDTQSDYSGPYVLNFEFAKYNIANTKFSPKLPDSTIAIPEITNLSNFESAIKTTFTDVQKTALTTSNFFITPNLDKFYYENPEEEVGRSDDWTMAYSSIGGGSIYQRKPENSVFISSDYLLHVYHRLLEKQFEYIEKNNFYPSLKTITDNVFEKAIKDYNSETDLTNKQSLERVITFFVVPKAIIDASYSEFSSKVVEDQKVDTDENIYKALDAQKDKLSETSYQTAKKELALILDQKSVTSSPLYGKLIETAGLQSNHDYTQYTPRSHYAKNSVLRSYFRSMMWFGRSYLAVTSPELTQDAINMSLLVKDTNSLKDWESIYIPTAFLVGKSDDLGIYEYSQTLEKLGKSSVSHDLVVQMQSEMKNYSGPQIQSTAFFGDAIFTKTKEELLAETKGFRFMGQRFTPDAFIFSSLTQGDEKPDAKTGESLPSGTTGLFVMKVLGNKTADILAQDWINTNAPNSKKVLADKTETLKAAFEKIPENVWTQNIYWGWLYTIKSVFAENTNSKGYPMFMRTDDWNKKALLTSLGSWTELKHDTLLYAKQSYAEMGGGGGDETIPEVPKGYVEPNIVFFDRLIALVDVTAEGLKNRGLMENEFKGRYIKLRESLAFFRTIAVKELQNEKITEDEFEKLRTEGGSLNYILSVIAGEIQYEKGARSALIADVHTDAKKGEILYEANGIPNFIYVAVKDVNGTRLTKGLVFSYYEFTNPLGERLTDEKWQALNYTQDKSKLPQAPTWVTSLIK